ncbi:FUSC family protein [Spirobacillus cienkowskii]|uniref:FUSC family protein n=1 Tax=Spirobacillus cienkowskii TaxID=495820 RepID=UPI0030D585B4
MEYINQFKNFILNLINFEIFEIKQAWRTSIVCVVCLFVNEKWLKTEFPGWIIITAIVCLQANFGATIIRVKERLFGTIFGCAAAFVVTILFQGNILIVVSLVLISCIFAIYNSVHTVYSYTYTVFFFTFGLISLYSLIFSDGVHFALLRVEDVAVGALFGTLGSLLLWPDFASNTFRKNLVDVVSETENLFQNIIDWVEDKIKDDEVYNQKVLSATNNQNARNKIIEIYYELGNRNYPLKEYEAFILSQERIHFSLLTIYNLLRIHTFEKNYNSAHTLYLVEQLVSIQNYFRVCVARLPLTKEKALQLSQGSQEYALIEKLEKEAINFIHSHQVDTDSQVTIQNISKHRSLLERLFEEVKSMNVEIDNIIEFYMR